MGLLSDLKRAIGGGSGGPELQIHRVRLVFPDAPNGLLVYATGAVFEEPGVFRCDEPVEIPDGTVLVQQGEEETIEVDSRSYPVRTYTMHAPENVPSDAETVEIPPEITGRPIPEQNPQDDDVQALRDALS